ncbi:cytochrome P450 [Schizophyllum commune H4-8]|nr:cytochrome P450 [Schizophyllum commune H4-8]KAI5890488.1 cytochrome P450 [Schizophyllum commune H4-8]
MAELSPIVLLVAALYAAIYLDSRHKRNSKLPLPPGPPGLPLLGNLLDLPFDFQWLKFAEWSKQCSSDVIHISVGGKSIIGLQSFEACFDLLERRSSNYSSRADTPMLDLMGWGFQLAGLKYGPWWRAHRRAFHNLFNIESVRRFLPQEKKATNMFLRRMLHAPTRDLRRELRFMVASIVMDVTYGIHAKPENDPYIEAADRSFHEASIAALPNSYWVNVFPLLKHVPVWMPGAGFKRHAKECKKDTEQMVNAPFKETIRLMTVDPSRTSFVSLSLEKARAKGDTAQEEVIKNTAGITYSGAMDTTVATLLNFTLHMLENPEIQRRAQDELDNVLDPGRLPDFDDEEKLPYITAIIRETMRIHPVAPMAVPHVYSGDVDDVYHGYTISRGSILIPNVWAITHDEVMYPDPYLFRPERFLTPEGKLDPTVRDPSSLVFGFGRRICPGRHLALASAWITVASVLCVYNIQQAKRPDGSTIPAVREYKSSILQSPEIFDCQFVPRNAESLAIIEATSMQEV